MIAKNDIKIMEMKCKIEKKRDELSKVKRFNPITNCVLDGKIFTRLIRRVY